MQSHWWDWRNGPDFLWKAPQNLWMGMVLLGLQVCSLVAKTPPNSKKGGLQPMLHLSCRPEVQLLYISVVYLCLSVKNGTRTK